MMEDIILSRLIFSPMTLKPKVVTIAENKQSQV